MKVSRLKVGKTETKSVQSVGSRFVFLKVVFFCFSPLKTRAEMNMLSCSSVWVKGILSVFSLRVQSLQGTGLMQDSQF